MMLNISLSLPSFIKGWRQNQGSYSFSLPAVNLMHILPLEKYEYGLSLLRQSIGLHEQKQGIPLEKSKQHIPFFRENRRMLVGPEMEMYAISMYEGEMQPPSVPAMNGPVVQISFDYKVLTEHCLSENYYLIRCKYDEQLSLKIFTKEMEKEYDKFFYDAEHTGFTADSHLFSMLGNACMEVRQPDKAGEKEWNIALFRHASEVEYEFMEGRLTPFVPIEIPANCIRKITMPDREKEILSYSALASFLQSKNLPPERYLEGLLES